MQVAVLADTQAPRHDMSELQSLADGDHAVNEQQGQNVVERAEGPVLRGDMSELQSLADDGDHAANEQQGQNLVVLRGLRAVMSVLGLPEKVSPSPGRISSRLSKPYAVLYARRMKVVKEGGCLPKRDASRKRICCSF